MIHYIPEEAYERPWWREPDYPLKGCIERLVHARWIKRVDGEEHDGALILNTSRLIRLMDIAETEMAQNSTSSSGKWTRTATTSTRRVRISVIRRSYRSFDGRIGT
ncbi:hypothetical protein [Corynebacterium singulare]|uniref:hypothetical protein n=1 Tax=Corynebacterium singulare TaxID=161899 RepID=UPI0011AA167C|nr:hypothetical protein [Corynebacterium singulare]